MPKTGRKGVAAKKETRKEIKERKGINKNLHSLQ
jgi:hypothetical protein